MITKALSWVAQHLALVIAFALALVATITGEYDQMEFFLILGMFAVLLNEVYENRKILREHLLELHKAIENDDNRDNSKDQQL